MDRPRLPLDHKPCAPRRRSGAAKAWAAVRRGAASLRRHPRLRHPGMALGAAMVGVALVSFALEIAQGSAIGERMRTQALSLPEPAPSLPALPEAGMEADAAPAPELREVTVRRGQTLAAIFSELGLSARDVHEVVNLDENTQRLTRIFPGDRLYFQLDDDGGLARLEYRLDEATRLRVLRRGETLVSELLGEELVREVREASGVIEDSLFLAGRRAGLTDAMILEMARLFGWDVDFVLDIRVGDRFHVIYEDIYRDGEFVRAGDILAATFVNQGRSFQAIRFDTGDGVGYFSPDGRNMKKAFLRAPLEFSHISSHFNPRRFHPILKRVKAHRGIDYAAPPGTPVYAAGDGRVVKAAYDRANGHHVFIKHPNGVTTKYLHFSRRAVKGNERVRQGQVIGYVGATGLATAPHLHYEFILDGVHRNPARVELPKAEPLPPEALARFQASARPLLAQLDRMAAGELIAASD